MFRRQLYPMFARCHHWVVMLEAFTVCGLWLDLALHSDMSSCFGCAGSLQPSGAYGGHVGVWLVEVVVFQQVGIHW